MHTNSGKSRVSEVNRGRTAQHGVNVRSTEQFLREKIRLSVYWSLQEWSVTMYMVSSSQRTDYSINAFLLL